MKAETPTDPVRQRQALRSRVFWFIAGAALNYTLIATPFKYLKNHTDLPLWQISGCSLAVSATFFFFWNYFINFRSDARRREALPRYLGAVALMWALSSTTLAYMKGFDAHMALKLGRFPIDLDIVATQFFLAGLKFFLYHRWVFPMGKPGGAKTADAPAPALTAER